MAGDGRVGGLYVTVGVDVKKAMSDTQRIHERLTRLSKRINTLGTGSKLPTLTRQLDSVARAAKKAADELARVGVRPSAVSGAPAQAAAAVTRAQAQAQQVMQQQINAAHAAAIKEEQQRQAAAAAAVKQQATVAAAAQRSAAQQTQAAQKAAQAQAQAAQRAAQQQMNSIHALALKENAAREKMARQAERQRQREVKAAQKAAEQQTKIRNVVGAGSQQLLLGLGAARSGNYFYGLAAAGRYASTLSSQMTRLGGIVPKVALGFGAIGLAVGAAAAGITALTVKISAFGVTQAANFQMLKIQLEGLLGSAGAAVREFSFLTELGKTSIVPTQSLIEADRQLLAFGLRADETRRGLVKFFSDFGTATGATEQQIYYLSLAISQVAALGKANTIDMRQLANAGINTMAIYEIIGQRIGKTAQEVAAGVSEGIITADRLFAALQQYGTGFEETARKARTSTIGLLRNIKDIVTTEMGKAFEGLNSSFSGFLQAVQDAVTKIDFRALADATMDAANAILSAMGALSLGTDGMVKDFNQRLPDAIRKTGYFFENVIKVARTAVEVVQILGRVLVVIVDLALMGILKVVGGAAAAVETVQNSIVPGLGTAMTGGIRQWLTDAGNEVYAWGETTTREIQSISEGINDIWAQGSQKILTYQTVYVTDTQGRYVGSVGPFDDPGSNKKPDPVIPPYVPSAPSAPSGGRGGGSKTNPAVERAQALIARMRELLDKAREASKAFGEALVQPFAKAIRKGGGEVNSALQTAFKSGDIDTIVGMFDTMKEAIIGMYSPLTSKVMGQTTEAIKRARKDRRRAIKELQADVAELVRLAARNEAINRELEEIERTYQRRVDELQQSRDALDRQYRGRQTEIARQYDGYYTAISRTEGTFTKGAIALAQEALDKATAAYESASAKLEELKQARDAFLEDIKSNIFEFVNSLSQINTEITKYTRLDEVGSFLLETDKGSSLENFSKSLAERLRLLKEWTANVRTLIQRGINGDLLQSLVKQGPEQAGELVSQLAGASDTELQQINSMQNELATEIANLQQVASARWFDAGIAAQEAFTAPLRAAYEQAQAQVATLTEQKDLALGVLEAWYAEQGELIQTQEDAALASYELQKKALQDEINANNEQAKKIADDIQTRFGALPLEAYNSGVAAVKGLTKGLEDEENLKKLRSAADRVAEMVASRIRKALDINSPSGVTEHFGQMVGAGLAKGMDDSINRVESSAIRLANAAIPAPSGVGGNSFNPTVKVFIGDKELTDLVDMRIETADAKSLDYVVAGRRY